MIADKNAYFAQLPNGYLIIENVPCRKCAQCGEVVYAASVMERIDGIIEKVQLLASKFLIMDYDRVA